MELEATVQAVNEESKSEKRARKRKKKLHQAVKSQMEFYFSDSNLMKDKFLGKLLAKNKEGWVPLDVFFHFNRIRSLNCTMKDICKAIKGSELLEVSSDEKCVRRLTSVAVKENVDQCTLYVEHLPSNVDHEWLKTVFSPFGLIDYVSLPRFKQKGTVKGFAFVEFSTPDEALKACKHFGYPEEESKTEGEETAEQTSRPKRKRGTSESDESGRKRVRQSSLSETSGKECSMQVPISKPEEPIPLKVAEEEEEQMAQDDKAEKKRKKRARKKKRKSQEPPEKPLPGIRVMPKEEWKRWKNKYLSMQKATMSQIKMSLSGVDAPSSLKENKDLRQASKNSPQLANPQAANEEVKEARKKKPVEFVEGTILRLKFKEQVSDPGQMKTQLRNLGNVAYVELEEGEKVAYVRCLSAEESKRLLSDVALPGKARLLEGEEEKSYWEKLQADRELKLNSQTKRKRRNQKVLTKVVKKHSTHIKFENE